MPAADHAEGRRRVEERCPPAFVVTVSLPALMRSGSTLSSAGVGTNAKDPVLGVENDLHTIGNVVGDQRGHPDSQVHVLPVGEFPGNAGGQFVAVQPLAS